MDTQVNFTTANNQDFGVQGFSSSALPAVNDPNAVSPNAIRWMFNPFAYINISERPVSGHAYLRSGSFIPIVNQRNRVSTSGLSIGTGMVGKKVDWSDSNTIQEVGVANGRGGSGDYRVETRTAFAISSELEDAYTDKGLRVLPSLTGFEDIDAVKLLHTAIVAGGLKFIVDPYQPDFPVPNLVALERYLQNDAMQAAKMFGGDLTINPTSVITDLLVGIRTALKTCRDTTNDAKRHVANRTMGYVHAFDAYQSRCFLALGENVPSDLPPTMQNTGGNGDELARLREENSRLRDDASLPGLQKRTRH